MKMRKLFLFSFCGALAAMLCGCGHNVGGFTIGTRAQFGIDPENMTANVSYVDGLNVVDVSRENSEWELEVDAENGITIDKQNGTIKGVKHIKRKVGPQVSGYLVDLAKASPELAKLYLETILKKESSK